MSDRPTAEVVRQLLEYDMETGRLHWLHRSEVFFTGSHDACERKCRMWNGRFAGKEAFVQINRDGYRYGILLNRSYSAHQIAWLIYSGEWSTPEMQIDHINGDKTDNRRVNLRLLPREVNLSARVRRSYKNGGGRGICFNKGNNKWQVSVPVGQGKSRYIGCFSSKEDAVRARDKALNGRSAA